jgi:prophage regulatory protein
MVQKLLPTPEILDRHLFGPSTLYQQIRDGVFTPPVRVGAKKSAWPEEESDAILRARIAGCTDEELRAIVQKLIADRANLADRTAA